MTIPLKQPVISAADERRLADIEQRGGRVTTKSMWLSDWMMLERAGYVTIAAFGIKGIWQVTLTMTGWAARVAYWRGRYEQSVRGS